MARLQREGESFIGAASAILLAILLQYSLPDRVSHYQRWIFPTVAALLLLVLVIGHRGRIDRQSRKLRGLTLLTIVVMSIANGVAAIRLVRDLVEGEGIRTPSTLLLAGSRDLADERHRLRAGVLDVRPRRTGGALPRQGHLAGSPLPSARRWRRRAVLWEPVFFDYFYTSFTNATAFSPTDVMPLSRWAKFAMTIESSVSLVLAILVVARAVNILG